MSQPLGSLKDAIAFGNPQTIVEFCENEELVLECVCCLTKKNRNGVDCKEIHGALLMGYLLLGDLYDCSTLYI